MSKKIFMTAVSLISAFMLAAAPSFADESLSEQNSSGTTHVQYSVAESGYDENGNPLENSASFIWAIPAEQIFSESNLEYKGQKVVVAPAEGKNAILKPAGFTIAVTVTSANGYKLKSGNSSIGYMVYKDGDSSHIFTAGTAAEVLKWVAGENDVSGKTVGLTFNTTSQELSKAAVSGIHEDSLTFTMTATRP